MEITKRVDYSENDYHYIEFQHGAISWYELSPGVAYIECVFIADAFRGLGYGTKALQWIINQYDKTYIVPNNERVISLYSRLGYKLNGDTDWEYSHYDLWRFDNFSWGVYRLNRGA